MLFSDFEISDASLISNKRVVWLSERFLSTLASAIKMYNKSSDSTNQILQMGYLYQNLTEAMVKKPELEISDHFHMPATQLLDNKYLVLLGDYRLWCVGSEHSKVK